MSRVGKQPVVIPSGVTVTINGQTVVVKGPKGELSETLHPAVAVKQEEGALTVTVKDPEDHKQRALWGLSRKLISNQVQGVTTGFSKQLEVNGVGFRVAVQGNKLTLNVGFSHPVEYTFPAGIECKVEKNVIMISGASRQVVGQIAAEIRAIKKPEPYKGKGIKYVDETLRRKVGKAAAKGE